MNERRRMSPFTAMFLGIFGVGAVGIASGSAIVLFAMHVLNQNANDVVALVSNTMEQLPELIESLPPTLKDLLNDRRAPEYAANLETDVNFVIDQRRGTIRPALTITNTGDELISFASLRISAVNADGVPLRVWTEVVATPIALDNDWPGPIAPNGTRHIVTSRGWNGLPASEAANIRAVVEINDIRVWRGEVSTIKTASAG